MSSAETDSRTKPEEKDVARDQIVLQGEGRPAVTGDPNIVVSHSSNPSFNIREDLRPRRAGRAEEKYCEKT